MTKRKSLNIRINAKNKTIFNPSPLHLKNVKKGAKIKKPR